MSTHGTTRGRAAGCTLALMLLCCLSACGYRSGLTLRGDYRSIGIEMFGNDGPLPGIEQELHEQVVRSARNLLPLPIRAPSDADVTIRGEIRTYSLRGGLRTRGNQLRSRSVRIQAVARLVSASGKLISGPVRASVSVGFVNGPGTLDEEARARAMKNAADLLILQLLVPKPMGYEDDDANRPNGQAGDEFEDELIDFEDN
ncbi:MAG: hypothetical protein ACI841_002015 [Planctomycetota bacterium]|jgi:hypothetical protein